MFSKSYLMRRVNDFVGSGYGYVPRWAYRVYGRSEWEQIRDLLKDWESRGFLEILKDPETASDDDYCTKMFNFVEGTEPLPSNWISYDRKPPVWQPSAASAGTSLD